MDILVNTIRIEINGKVSSVSALKALPAPYDIRLVMLKPDLLLIEVRHPSELE